MLFRSTSGSSVITARPNASLLSERPGPDVVGTAKLPANEAPMAVQIPAISSSACTVFTPRSSRLASLKSVALLLWEKAKDFLQRAFTVIFLATIIIWFLQSFDIRLNVVADSADSLLALIGRWIAPVFAPLGFADWRCATSLISGFIAKESVVSTLEVLLGGTPLSTMFTNRSAASFLVFTLLYTPCIAAVATIRREFGSTLKTVGIVLMQCCVAWIAASVVYALIGIL